jgi:hypothetical protein
MDSYGVVSVGSYLVSIPGVVVYLLVLGSLLWATRRRKWLEVLVLLGFNIAWVMLGLSFIVHA